MQFDSLGYVIFFILVVLSYQLIRSWSMKKNMLLLSSYIFYSAWNPLFLPLLLFSTTMDYSLARWMSRREGVARKIGMAVIVMANLLILFYFKYIVFFMETLTAVLGPIGLEIQQQDFDIILPLGISFYTFHSLSYCIDVYRKKFKPTKNWRDYALYVSFFPQLVAGPITRWTYMREQIEKQRTVDYNSFFVGLCLLVFGLFEKIVLADSLFAPAANELFANQQPNAAEAWLAMWAFSGQIFCDFAGYSTCAIGSAMMLGFRLPENFRTPYAAAGFSEFWQRWHISLSSWLRDYLYIPLGGNRYGRWKTYRNLMLTMLIGGLWHGAGWTFIVWGALHGCYLIVERLAKYIYSLTGLKKFFWIKPLVWFGTLLAVCYAWIWFRSGSAEQAFYLTARLMELGSVIEQGVELQWAHSVAGCAFWLLVIVHLIFRKTCLIEYINRLHPVILIVLFSMLIISIIFSPGDGNAFIYFQF